MNLLGDMNQPTYRYLAKHYGPLKRQPGGVYAGHWGDQGVIIWRTHQAYTWAVDLADTWQGVGRDTPTIEGVRYRNNRVERLSCLTEALRANTHISIFGEGPDTWRPVDK